MTNHVTTVQDVGADAVAAAVGHVRKVSPSARRAKHLQNPGRKLLKSHVSSPHDAMSQGVHPTNQ
jgi:hypothetical protein